MLPSSSAGPAIAAGYGVDLKTMFSSGAKLTALIFGTLVAGRLSADEVLAGIRLRMTCIRSRITRRVVSLESDDRSVQSHDAVDEHADDGHDE